MILNIETSETCCSIALTEEGQLFYEASETEPMRHAVVLGPFIEKALTQMERHDKKLDAVAVSIGPGSYTGLRIGLSMAKGICFGMDVPLIGIDTLKIWAVKGMFKSFDLTGEELLVPMLDARRMEVYTCAYDFMLNEVMSPGPLILDEGSYGNIDKDKKLVFMGSGVAKACKAHEEGKIILRDNVEFLEMSKLHAADMMALSEKALRENDFMDLAYSTPKYLKEFQATAPKKMF